MKASDANRILNALKDNILYVVLFVVLAVFTVTVVVINQDESEPIIVYSDSEPADTQAQSEAASSTQAQASTATHKSVSSTSTEAAVKTGVNDAQASQQETSEQTEQTQPTVQFPLDINTCTADELILIDGIGEATAAKIISYRNEIGVIYNMELLLNISGIGDSTLNLLKQYAYVSEYDYRDIALPAEAKITQQTTQTAVQTQETTAAATTQTAAVYEEPVRQTVNINTADAQEISQKLLIDLELAEEIINTREEVQIYSNVLELLYVKGMSEELLVQLRDYILL